MNHKREDLLDDLEVKLAVEEQAKKIDPPKNPAFEILKTKIQFACWRCRNMLPFEEVNFQVWIPAPAGMQRKVSVCKGCADEVERRQTLHLYPY